MTDNIKPKLDPEHNIFSTRIVLQVTSPFNRYMYTPYQPSEPQEQTCYSESDSGQVVSNVDVVVLSIKLFCFVLKALVPAKNSTTT